MRRLTRAVTRAFTAEHAPRRRSSLRRTASAECLLSDLPNPERPSRTADFSRLLPDFEFSTLLQAIESQAEGAFFETLMQEGMGCYNIRATSWEQFEPPSGLEARSSLVRYTMPPPADIPEIARKFVKVPDEIHGTTVSWYTCSGSAAAGSQEVVLVQRCATEGVMYSDRFHVQLAFHFREAPSGGAHVEQWVDIVWSRPLPWTHTVLTRTLESKVRSDAADKFPQMLAILGRSCDALAASTEDSPCAKAHCGTGPGADDCAHHGFH